MMRLAWLLACVECVAASGTWRRIIETEPGLVIDFDSTVLVLQTAHDTIKPWIANGATWVAGDAYSPCADEDDIGRGWQGDDSSNWTATDNITQPVTGYNTADNVTSQTNNTESNVDATATWMAVAECDHNTTIVAFARHANDAVIITGDDQFLQLLRLGERTFVRNSSVQLPFKGSFVALNASSVLAASSTSVQLYEKDHFTPIWKRDAESISGVSFAGNASFVFPSVWTLKEYDMVDIIQVVEYENMTAILTNSSVVVWEKWAQKMHEFEGAYSAIMAACCSVVLAIHRNNNTVVTLLGPTLPQVPSNTAYETSDMVALSSAWPNRVIAASEGYILESSLCPPLSPTAIQIFTGPDSVNDTFTVSATESITTDDCVKACKRTWPCRAAAWNDSNCILSIANMVELCPPDYQALFQIENDPIPDHPVSITSGEVIGFTPARLVSIERSDNLTLHVMFEKDDGAYRQQDLVYEDPPVVCNLCLENYRVRSNVCVPCETGRITKSGDDRSGEDTTCDWCDENFHVNSNECLPCPVGSIRPRGDDRLGDATFCNYCAENFHVSNQVCRECPSGTSRPAGDHRRSHDTSCDLCAENYYVKDNQCKPCERGHSRPGGDNSLDGDTSCDICLENYYVKRNVCTLCVLGYIHPAGDVRTGPDTECTMCKVNHFVENHKCVRCPDGTLERPAGDNIYGPDTACPPIPPCNDGDHGPCVDCGPSSMPDRPSCSDSRYCVLAQGECELIPPRRALETESVALVDCPAYRSGVTAFNMDAQWTVVGFARNSSVNIYSTQTFDILASFHTPCAPLFLATNQSHLMISSENHACVYHYIPNPISFQLKWHEKTASVTAVALYRYDVSGHVIANPHANVQRGQRVNVIRHVSKLVVHDEMLAAITPLGVSVLKDNIVEVFEGAYASVTIYDSVVETIILATRVAFGMPVEVVTLKGSLKVRYHPTSSIFLSSTMLSSWYGLYLAHSSFDHNRFPYPHHPSVLVPSETLIDRSFGVCAGEVIHTIPDIDPVECQKICDQLWNCAAAMWNSTTHCSFVDQEGIPAPAWCPYQASTLAYMRKPPKVSTDYRVVRHVHEGEHVLGFSEELLLLTPPPAKNDTFHTDRNVTVWRFDDEWIPVSSFLLPHKDSITLDGLRLVGTNTTHVTVRQFSSISSKFDHIATLSHSCGDDNLRAFAVPYPFIVVAARQQWCAFVHNRTSSLYSAEISGTSIGTLATLLEVNVDGNHPSLVNFADVRFLEVRGKTVKTVSILVADAVFLHDGYSRDPAFRTEGTFFASSAMPSPVGSAAVGLENLHGYPAKVIVFFGALNPLYLHPATTIVTSGTHWRSYSIAVDGSIYTVGMCYSTTLLRNTLSRAQCKTDCDKVPWCEAATWGEGECGLSVGGGQVELCNGLYFAYVKPTAGAEPDEESKEELESDFYAQPIAHPGDDDRELTETNNYEGFQVVAASNEMIILQESFETLELRYWKSDHWASGPSLSFDKSYLRNSEMRAIAFDAPHVLLTTFRNDWNTVSLSLLKVLPEKDVWEFQGSLREDQVDLPCGIDLLAFRAGRLAHAGIDGNVCAYQHWTHLFDRFSTTGQRRTEASDGNDESAIQIIPPIIVSSNGTSSISIGDDFKLTIGTSYGMARVDLTTAVPGELTVPGVTPNITRVELSGAPITAVRVFGNSPSNVVVTAIGTNVVHVYDVSADVWHSFEGHYTSCAAVRVRTGDLIVLAAKFYYASGGAYSDTKVNTHVESLMGDFPMMNLAARDIDIVVGTDWESVTVTMFLPAGPMVSKATSVVLHKGLCFQDKLDCAEGQKNVVIERAELNRVHCREACDFQSACTSAMFRNPSGDFTKGTCVLFAASTWKWCTGGTFGYLKQTPSKTIALDFQDGDFDEGQVGGIVYWEINATFPTHFHLALANEVTSETRHLCDLSGTQYIAPSLPCAISAASFPNNVSIAPDVDAGFTQMQIQALFVGKSTAHVVKSDVFTAEIRDCHLLVGNLSIYDITESCGELGGDARWDVQYACNPEESRVPWPSLIGYELVLRPKHADSFDPQGGVNEYTGVEAKVAFAPPGEQMIHFDAPLYYNLTTVNAQAKNITTTTTSKQNADVIATKKDPVRTPFAELCVFPVSSVGRHWRPASYYVVDLGTNHKVERMTFSDSNPDANKISGCLRWSVELVKHSTCLSYRRVLYATPGEEPTVLGYIDPFRQYFNVETREILSNDAAPTSFEDIETWVDRLTPAEVPIVDAAEDRYLPPLVLTPLPMSASLVAWRAVTIESWCAGDSPTPAPTPTPTPAPVEANPAPTPAPAPVPTHASEASSDTSSTEEASCNVSINTGAHPIFILEAALLWREWDISPNAAPYYRILQHRDPFHCGPPYPWPGAESFDLVLADPGCINATSASDEDGDAAPAGDSFLPTCMMDIPGMQVTNADFDVRFDLYCVGTISYMMQSVLPPEADFCVSAMQLEQPQLWRHAHVKKSLQGLRVKECNVNMWITRPHICRQCSLIYNTHDDPNNNTAKAGCFLEHRAKCSTRELEEGLYSF